MTRSKSSLIALSLVMAAAAPLAAQSFKLRSPSRRWCIPDRAAALTSLRVPLRT
jgi:hypothetical protein